MDQTFQLLTSNLAGPFGYVGVLALLTICGLGVPIPEDIILISGGYIAASAHHGPVGMMVTGLIGIMFGDSIIYYMGRRFGLPIAQRTPLRRVLTTDRLARVEALFQKYGQVILVAARFMPGVRAVAFFTAGSTGVPYYKFAFYDGMAALVSAPLWVYLGYKFSSNIDDLWAKAHSFQQYILFAVFGAIAAYLVYRFFTKKKQAPATPAQATVRVDETSTP